jgi:LPS O-antigen subunit length determinant protein (WzzB/FepE family)
VQNELEGVRSAIRNAGGRNAIGNLGGSGTVRNDAYVQLSAQLNSIQTQIRSIEEQRRQLREERETLQEQLARAPAVEREYTRLTRSLENAITDREALADKETSASLSGALESAAISERFVLAEPASLPVAPVSPKEKLILAVGFVLAMGSGGAAVLLAELFDRSIRSVGQLAQLMGDTPLAVIPTISSPAERRRVWGIRLAIALLVIAGGVGAGFWVHHAVAPLDVLGYQLQGSVERWLAINFPGADPVATDTPSASP